MPSLKKWKQTYYWKKRWCKNFQQRCHLSLRPHWARARDSPALPSLRMLPPSAGANATQSHPPKIFFALHSPMSWPKMFTGAKLLLWVHIFHLIPSLFSFHFLFWRSHNTACPWEVACAIASRLTPTGTSSFNNLSPPTSRFWPHHILAASFYSPFLYFSFPSQSHGAPQLASMLVGTRSRLWRTMI